MAGCGSNLEFFAIVSIFLYFVVTCLHAYVKEHIEVCVRNYLCSQEMCGAQGASAMAPPPPPPSYATTHTSRPPKKSRCSKTTLNMPPQHHDDNIPCLCLITPKQLKKMASKQTVTRKRCPTCGHLGTPKESHELEYNGNGDESWSCKLGEAKSSSSLIDSKRKCQPKPPKPTTMEVDFASAAVPQKSKGYCKVSPSVPSHVYCSEKCCPKRWH